MMTGSLSSILFANPANTTTVGYSVLARSTVNALWMYDGLLADRDREREALATNYTITKIHTCAYKIVTVLLQSKDTVIASPSYNDDYDGHFLVASI